jgi:PhoH-like ATPase
MVSQKQKQKQEQERESRTELLGKHNVPDGAKVYILDTSALMQNYEILKTLRDNIKVIPLKVLDQLDNHKDRADEQGRNVRSVIRYLDGLRNEGFLKNGQADDVGGIVFVDFNQNDLSLLPDGMEIDSDARIILVAVEWQKEFPNMQVEAISEDINFRLRADVCGIKCEGYKKNQVRADEFYSGIVKLPVVGSIIDLFYKKKGLITDKHDVFNEEMIFPNQFFLLKNGSQSALARYRNGQLAPLLSLGNLGIGFKDRNVEQQFALELLLDETVSNITLSGNAGSGKTLLALAAGFDQVVNQKKYKKIMVFRPLVPMGKDLGFLPGDKEEKLDPWMTPIYRKLELIVQMMFNIKEGLAVGGARAKRKEKIDIYIDKLLDDGIVEMESLTYTRGDEFEESYVILDEGQNTTPHEVKTFVSRAGKGTKMVLTGDPYQIDSPYMDAGSNGLSYLTERFKHLSFSGHVTLVKGLRSEQAAAASEYL